MNGVLASTAIDFTAITSVADTVVTLVGDVVGMITSNPILLLGIGIGLFYGAVRIVKSFV